MTQAGGDVLLIVEGESDAAVAIDLKFAVVGLPGVRSCWSMLKHVIGNYHAVVIAFDADDPGRRAASDLARKLAAAGPAVRILRIPEPYGDLREWRQAGATGDDVRTMIGVASPSQPIRTEELKPATIRTYIPPQRRIRTCQM